MNWRRQPTLPAHMVGNFSVEITAIMNGNIGGCSGELLDEVSSPARAKVSGPRSLGALTYNSKWKEMTRTKLQ